MAADMCCDISYYEYLDIVQKISKDHKSIQRKSMTIIYQNYDLNLVKKRIKNKISNLDKLIEQKAQMHS